MDLSIQARSSKHAQIKSAALKQMIDSGNPFTLINVLTQDAYDDCHIKHTNNNNIPDCVPFNEIEKIAPTWGTNVKDQPIYIYCASEKCVAGQLACDALKKLGFTNIIEYKRGMREWLKLGYPRAGSCKMEYLFNK